MAAEEQARDHARSSEARLRILVLGLNHAPEMVGIGLYTAEMAQWLATAGHEVSVVAGKPYYPAWRIFEGYRRRGAMRAREAGVDVLRCDHYVPSRPSGVRRILQHLSFAAFAWRPTMALARQWRPEVVMTIAPSLLSAPLGRRAARAAGGAAWLHIQDFEVEAAFATGLLARDGWSGKLARAFQGHALAGFDRYSSISPQMCAKLVEEGAPAARIVEFRNWADIDHIRPSIATSPLREVLGISAPQIALYSGNIANKQGIEIIVAAARLLRERKDLLFLICGDGPRKGSLIEEARDLANVRFLDLQPRERLGDLLALATVHLLPQMGGAADLVLPSKLTNMLASGRPVVATAMPGTGLADEVAGCGALCPPGDAQAFAAAIAALVDSPDREALGHAARLRAEERWSKNAILSRFEAELVRMAAGRRAGPASPGSD